LEYVRVLCFKQGEVQGKRRRRTRGSYWMTLRRRKDPGAWKRVRLIALAGERALEDAMDLS
jgi:hypothetical protein